MWQRSKPRQNDVYLRDIDKFFSNFEWKRLNSKYTEELLFSCQNVIGFSDRFIEHFEYWMQQLTHPFHFHSNLDYGQKRKEQRDKCWLFVIESRQISLFRTENKINLISTKMNKYFLVIWFTVHRSQFTHDGVYFGIWKWLAHTKGLKQMVNAHGIIQGICKEKVRKRWNGERNAWKIIRDC